MSKGSATAQLLGNLTKDPELTSTNNGKNVLSFTLAINHNKETTSFIDCVAWEKTAENIAQYTKKGQQLFVSGRLVQRTWEKNGEKRSRVEVSVQEAVFTASALEKRETTDVVPDEVEDTPIDISSIPF